MTAETIQIKYEQVRAIARQFGELYEEVLQLYRRIEQAELVLQQGGWAGRTAEAFFREMEAEVYPAVRNLAEALNAGQQVTLEIITIVQHAEQVASSVYQQAYSSAASTAPGERSDAIKTLTSGLWDRASDPVGRAQELWQAVAEPEALWQAFSQPSVEAGQHGDLWQMIGSGGLFMGARLSDWNGASLAAQTAKLRAAAQLTGQAADLGAHFGTVEAAAQALGTVARGSRVEAALGRYIAQQSTHAVAGAKRVVFGGFTADPEGAAPPFIAEAHAGGGTYYDPAPEVWQAIKPAAEGGSGRAWLPQREFLQTQLEQGVPRIELYGETVSEVLLQRPKSATAQQIRYLQRYAYEYGYRQVGDSWLKTGDWRASPGSGSRPELDGADLEPSGRA